MEVSLSLNKNGSSYNAKTPLVQFQWMELDQNKMQQLLEFWQSHAQEQPEMTLLDLMKLAAESEE